MATQRLLIIQAVQSRMADISVAHGYETDIGQAVFLGEKAPLSDADPAQVVAIVLEDEEQGWQLPGKAGESILPVTLQGIAKVDPHETDSAVLMIETIIGDVQKSMERDANLGGLTNWSIERGPVRSLQREPGSTYVGAAVTYRIRFKRGFGTP